jgi:carbamoyl-phosphate synthase small subunit
MTGYQEVLTDPSYAGQIVTMTTPQIGNYGVAAADVESDAPKVAGFIIRDQSPIASNWRAQATLKEYLTANHIVAIADIDTRALTRKLRSAGVMRGVIATGAVDPQALAERARAIPLMEGMDLVKEVTCAAPYDFSLSLADTVAAASFAQTPEKPASRPLKVAAYDYGIKTNILRRLVAHGCQVRVFPAMPAADLLACARRHLQQRPGRSVAVGYAIDNVKAPWRTARRSRICLGHQPRARPGASTTSSSDTAAPTSGEVPRHRRRRDHVAEPRLRRGSRFAAGRHRDDAQEPVRRHGRGHPAHLEAALLRAVPPRGVARAP